MTDGLPEYPSDAAGLEALNRGPRPRCATHPDVELVAIPSGWVCRLGCSDVAAGRRYRLDPDMAVPAVVSVEDPSMPNL